jgi:hypothetical protein
VAAVSDCTGSIGNNVDYFVVVKYWIFTIISTKSKSGS